jgi:hypothetical protein
MSNPWIVLVEFNTEADGSPVADDAPHHPRCLYGPFLTEAAALHWMHHVYPDGDTDVHDMWAIGPSETGELNLNVLNAPDTVVGGDRCLDCGLAVVQRPEKALSGEWAMVWADVDTGAWVCAETGNEHRPS